MKNIKAFGKMVDRDKAYQIIINDKMNEIVYARMYEMFEDLLMSGWKGLYDWTDKELEVRGIRYTRHVFLRQG